MIAEQSKADAEMADKHISKAKIRRFEAEFNYKLDKQQE